MTRSKLVILGLVASFALPNAARASDQPLAEALFQSGKALMQAGDYESACSKFRESFTHEAATGTLLSLAMCLERAGRLASAWAAYSELAAYAHKEQRMDRESAARERVAELGPRLSTLAVRVPEAVAVLPGLIVKRDGEAIANAAWNVALPVDGGAHVLDVSADGRKPWHATITLSVEGDAAVADVPLLEYEPPGTSAARAPLSPPGTSSKADRGSHEDALRPLGFVALGLGGAALAVGAVFAIKAQSADHDSKAGGHCNLSSQCDAAGFAARNQAFTDASRATVLLAAGAVLAGSGITLYLVSPKSRGQIAVAPVIGVRSAALSIGGSF